MLKNIVTHYTADVKALYFRIKLQNPFNIFHNIIKESYMFVTVGNTK